MNIPKDKLILALQNLCEEYAYDQSIDRYRAKLAIVTDIFSVGHILITANVEVITSEDVKACWGENLFKSLKEQQEDLGVDYD